MIYPDNPVQATWIFSTLLGLGILFSLRRRKDKELFPVSATQELKGFAILVIIFAHIGYSLSADSKFLWPLSNLAGVGVNIFLFVSGFGLTSSNLKRKLGILEFYMKRLRKLFLPFWLVLALYFVLDYLFLHRNYSLDYIVHSFLGIFRTADIHNDIDSPLWYFTLIGFYYLLYPLVFIRRWVWLSALVIYAVTIMLIRHTFIRDLNNIELYEVYTTAFPLGMVAAWLHHNKSRANKQITAISRSVHKLTKHRYVKSIMLGLALFGLAAAFYICRYYTGPDDSPHREQLLNIVSMCIILMFFMLKRLEIKLFYIFGVYSYEVYLLHWPLISRYDAFFGRMPDWLAVVLYLAIFLGLGWLLQNVFSLPAKIKTHFKQAST